MKNLLTVIVPVYNVEAYLARCLDSVLNQTYTNLEIICVNDGSTDGSPSILNQYAAKDSRIKIIHQQNGGMSAARNAGIDAASGTYITFVDSDDFINPEAYGLCMPLFHMDIEVVIFSAKIVVEDNSLNWGNDGYFQVHEQNYTVVTPSILQNENVSVWNKVYKTEIIKKNNIRFPLELWYEDNEFYWKYMSFVRHAYFLKNQLYNYVRRSGSIMFSTFLNNEKTIDHFAIYEHLLAFWQTNSELTHFIETSGAAIFNRFFYFTYIYSVHRDQIIRKAREIVDKYGLVKLFPDDKLINALAKNQLYCYNWIDEYSFIQKLFSVKKIGYDKIIYLCFCRIGIKRKKYKLILKQLKINQFDKLSK